MGNQVVNLETANSNLANNNATLNNEVSSLAQTVNVQQTNLANAEVGVENLRRSQGVVVPPVVVPNLVAPAPVMARAPLNYTAGLNGRLSMVNPTLRSWANPTGL